MPHMQTKCATLSACTGIDFIIDFHGACIDFCSLQTSRHTIDPATVIKSLQRVTSPTAYW